MVDTSNVFGEHKSSFFDTDIDHYAARWVKVSSILPSVLDAINTTNKLYDRDQIYAITALDINKLFKIEQTVPYTPLMLCSQVGFKVHMNHFNLE